MPRDATERVDVSVPRAVAVLRDAFFSPRPNAVVPTFVPTRDCVARDVVAVRVVAGTLSV